MRLLSPSEVEARAKTIAERPDPEPARLPDPLTTAAPKREERVTPMLLTMLVVTVAVLLGWAMWDAYMGAPWTRDGTVRAYVVTMAPEVAGHIVEMPVVDNKYVHKGDLLMVIDPTNYDDRRQPGRGSGAAGRGERAEHRRADRCPAGTDQCQPGTG